MDGLGSAGLFTAIVIAIIVVRVQKFFTDANLVIKLPESVPPVVYESFLSLTPLLFLVLVFWVIRFVIGVDINGAVQDTVRAAGVRAQYAARHSRLCVSGHDAVVGRHQWR